MHILETTGAGLWCYSFGEGPRNLNHREKSGPWSNIKVDEAECKYWKLQGLNNLLETGGVGSSFWFLISSVRSKVFCNPNKPKAASFAAYYIDATSGQKLLVLQQ